MTDNITFAARVQDILNDATLDEDKKKSRLRLMSYEALDADDDAGYEAIGSAYETAFGRSMPMSGSINAMYGRGGMLVATEKYGSRYFDVSTPDLFAGACLHLVKERLDQGYYTQDCPYEEKPDAMMSAYLASFKVSPPADPTVKGAIRDAVKEWRSSDAFQILLERPSGAVFAYLKMVVAGIGSEREPTPEEDAFAAFLSLVIREKESCGTAVRNALLEFKAGPICKAVIASINPSDEELARESLEEAATGNLRRAGRFAYELLRRRSDGQYEGIELERLETVDPTVFLGKEPAP